MNTTPSNHSSSANDQNDASRLSEEPQMVDHVILARNSSDRTDLSSFDENDNCNRIFREGNGKGLMKFCRELAVILIRRYSVEDDAKELRGRLTDSLTATLKCSEMQANCLIDLSLELIHSKVHGNYRRSDLELSYLIALASGVVDNVAAN